jgi:hypothetical protein
VTRGPKPSLAIVAALFVFGLGCIAIVGIGALVSGWREAAVMELFDEEDLADFDFDEGDGTLAELPARDDRVDPRAARHSDPVGF